MNGAARPNRARRGRLLIVGETPELDALLVKVQLASGPPTRVRNLFEALGEITTAPAGLPIATVLLSESHMPPMSDRAIESMHKVDPSLRIVMIVDGSITVPPSRDWLSLGIDECVEAPIAVHDLARLFEDDFIAGGTPLDVKDHAKPSEPQSAAEPFGQVASKTGVAVSHEPAKAQEIPESVAPTPAQIIGSSPETLTPPRSANDVNTAEGANAPPAQLLGDTDLVESILGGAGNLHDLALQLIAQQTGWHDVAITEDRTADSVAITFADDHFGWLGSARASAEQMQPWADWLARWLALNQSHCACRLQAFQDDLTGAGNRRDFEEFLSESIKSAARVRRPLTLMIFDIDNFKSYNDQFGHDAGDDILRETVRLMQSVIRQGDRVCRIGGDEFAVIFADEEAPRAPGSRHPESIELMAKRFQDQICKMRFPKLGPEAPGTLTISAGLATYPWDGADPEALLRHADQLALESKRKGKNLITFGPGAMRACRPAE